MFLSARQAAATFAGRDGLTSTTSTRARSMGAARVYARAAARGPSRIIEAHAAPESLRLTVLRPLPRPLARALSLLVLAAWLLNMGLLLRHALASSSVALAADLGDYAPSAQWRGIYYRGRQDRLLGRPDDADARRLRDPRGRPAADEPARRDDLRPAEQPGTGRSRLRPAPILLLARPGQRSDRGRGRGGRHAAAPEGEDTVGRARGDTRAVRAAGAVDEPAAGARRTGARGRQDADRLRLRSRDAAQRADAPRGATARRSCRRRAGRCRPSSWRAATSA